MKSFVFPIRARKLGWLSAIIFSVRACTAADVTLAWDPSPDTNVVAYRVYYGTAAATYASFVQVAAPATSAAVAGLLSSATYFFAAKAVNTEGVESDFSNETSFAGAAENSPPTAVALNIAAVEESAVHVLLSGSDADGNPLTYAVIAAPINGTLSGTAPNLVYTPKPNFFGSDQFTYSVSDGIATAMAAVTIQVAAVNDAPTINAPPGMIISQNAGPQTVALTGITSGALNEADRLTVTASVNNPNVIPTPTVTYVSPASVGALVFTPNANAIGWSIITLTVNDGASTNNLATQTFWVLINNPPTLNPVASVVINEDAGDQTVPLSGITSGAANEIQPLTISATSSNPALIPNPTVTYASPNSSGTLQFAPAANASGTATITVKVSDGQYGNNLVTRTFNVTVNPVNDAPTLNAISSMTVDAAVARSVSLSGIGSGAPNENQALIVTAQSSNPLLIPTPVVTYSSPNSSGVLTFTPLLNQTGTATITVTVNDGQLANNLITQTFTVTVSSLPKISGLTAGALDTRTIQVAWNTDKTATCVVEYGTTAMVDQVSAQSFGTTHAVTLTNLQAGTLYYLRVKATTSSGAATAVATAATDAPQVAQWAAESGQFSGPIKIYSSAEAENGKYVATSVKNKSGSASFSFNLLRGPNYRMWARVKTSVGGGTFSVSTDGAAENSVFVSDTGAKHLWHWAPVMDNANRTIAFTLPLDAGPHTFVMRGALTAWWDEFIIVNDPTWQPILPTTRPTLSATRDSAQTATLTWNDPSGNATAVGVEYSTDGVNFTWCTGAPATASSVTVGNLGALTYYFRVYSYNSVDRTAYSNVAAALH